MGRFVRVALSVALAAATAPGYAPAQVADHLECYGVKDPQAKATYTVDLAGLAPEPGCVVKVPAKLLCVATAKTNVTPTPPGAGAGDPAGRYLCYKVKCQKGVRPPVSSNDQFGTRTLEPRRSKLLCAPELPVATTTTTTLPPSCADSQYPQCGGTCPLGLSCYPVFDQGSPGGPRCFCATPGVPCSTGVGPSMCGGLACGPDEHCVINTGGETCSGCAPN